MSFLGLYSKKKDGNAAAANGSIYTKPGSLPTCSFDFEEGTKGVCQDTFLACEGFLGEDTTTVIAAIDGHGNDGHVVAQSIRDTLPTCLALSLEHHLQPLECIPGPPPTFPLMEGKGAKVAPLPHAKVQVYHCSFSSAVWRDAMSDAFRLVDDGLKALYPKRTYQSGATAAVVLRRGVDLIVSHIGDTRAVMGKYMAGKLHAEQLTNDHKVGNPSEKARVVEAGGRVMNFNGSVDRVFNPAKPEHGLAIARSFGDFDLKDHGVISKPDVKCHRLQPSDKFVIIASDGLWDVMTNSQAVDIVGSTNKDNAPRKLIKAAMVEWTRVNPLRARDDISIVILYFGS